MTTYGDSAVAEMDKGFNCAVSVLSTFAEKYGLTLDQARRVAGGMGGGIGRSGGVCGVVSGSVMVLGLAYGKTDGQDHEAGSRCYNEAKLFLERFHARCGATDCRTLLGYDVSLPGQYEAAAAAGAFKVRCRELLRVACELLEQQLVL